MAEADIILRNTGKVEFDFNFLLEDQHMAPKDILPGQPLVIPSTVKILHSININFVSDNILPIYSIHFIRNIVSLFPLQIKMLKKMLLIHNRRNPRT